MAVMLFNLRGVPDDEIAEVRQLLIENEIEFYETPPGNWGISMPAYWVKDQAEKDRAEPLLSNYQQQRSENAKSEYQRSQESGEAKPVLLKLLSNPVRNLIYLAFIILILYLSINPFLSLGS